MLAGGSLGDHLGRRRVFAFGIVLFAAGSLWCGAAPDPSQLIAARAVQGFGAAMLIPGSLALITGAFPKEERGRAIGTWSAATSLAVIAGPLLGGFLVQMISWRAVFYINIPIAAATLLTLQRCVPVSRTREAGRIDWIGTLLVTVALGAITFTLIEAPERGWRMSIAATAVIGVVAFVAILVVERGVSPVRRDDVAPVPKDRRARRPHRPAPAADRRPGRGRRQLRPPRAPLGRRLLLDDVLPRHPGPRPRDGHHRGAADDDGDDVDRR